MSASEDGVCALCGKSLQLGEAVWLAVATKQNEGAMVFAAHPECFVGVAAPPFVKAVTSPPAHPGPPALG